MCFIESNTTDTPKALRRGKRQEIWIPSAKRSSSSGDALAASGFSCAATTWWSREGTLYSVVKVDRKRSFRGPKIELSTWLCLGS